MKHLSTIVLVALIVFFPLASWYYLQTGLDYRKDALKELESKGPFPFIEEVSRVNIEGYTNIIFHDTGLEGKMKLIHDQFNDSRTFQLVQVTQDMMI